MDELEDRSKSARADEPLEGAAEQAEMNENVYFGKGWISKDKN